MWQYFSKVDKIEHSSVIMVEITIMNENKYMNEIQDKLYLYILIQVCQIQTDMLLGSLEIGIKIYRA